ncbi:hypothetical protein BY996DRAFT_4580055 [Phakopsora pachyrhizi]|uniref:Secreted protein n=1 Tax=Phakopsora pachyrhizi TaxID=170000 RepID=A0AAV0AEG5_PHAPC|nr:hypothetical protein BY996DRAFT_4597791 [Phakopsora pachyrhizi]KAI8456091.1 hypothetical protein BY996DRAFT_4580055 [Phakopsora pachyrhizi]CAH7666469.1 hypothetical protein PPACK8108_LOCUS821 [Phakopsora pachyrhizi]CAH7685321.1 hypothetical protein PPACK8108_LOCUS19821 [Phakopsora pachyrhizi]
MVLAATNLITVVKFFIFVTYVQANIRGIDVNNPPYQTIPGRQYGYNQCGSQTSSDSKCQNLWIKNATDFCLFGPATFGGVSEQEREAVAYCTQSYHGARVIPPGTFTSVHFVYVQITGRGNFSKINVSPDTDGGEYGVCSADALGNPIGGLVFGTDNQYEQWTEFLLSDEFCIRACKNGPDAWRECNHIYDEMACRWNIPGDYSPGFDSCEGERVNHPMGEYIFQNGSTYFWKQGENPVPPPGDPGKVENCKEQVEFSFP